MKDTIDKLKQFFKLLNESFLVKILLLIFTILFLASFSIQYFEDSINNPIDAAWWAIVTITTVGYGDITPSTTMGRIIGVILILFGMILISLFTATISSIMVEMRLRENQGLNKVNLKNHTIICGWNWNTETLLKALYKNVEKIDLIIINELSPDDASIILEKYKGNKLKFIRGDFSKNQVLEKASIKFAKNVIIVPDSSTKIADSADEKTIFATMTIKSIAKNVKVFAQIINKDKLQYLKRANVDEFFHSDEIATYFLASNVISPGTNDVLKTILDYENDSILKTKKIPRSFIGKPYKDLILYFRQSNNSQVIALIQEQDILKIKNIDINENSIEAFIKRKFEESGRMMKDLEEKKIIINPIDNYIIKEYQFAVVISEN